MTSSGDTVSPSNRVKKKIAKATQRKRVSHPQGSMIPDTVPTVRERIRKRLLSESAHQTDTPKQAEELYRTVTSSSKKHFRHYFFWCPLSR